MNSTHYGKTEIEIWSAFLEKSFQEKTQWINIMCVVIFLIIFFVSLVGNVITCYVIYSVKSMHTATNFYLFDLAVSDLIVTFTVIIDIYEYLTDYSHLDQSLCKLRFFFVTTLWNNGVLVMTTLAIERYIVIWHPMWLSSSPIWKRVAKVITIIWIVAILESVPEMWTVNIIRLKKDSICFTIPTEVARKINGLLALVTFVIPLMIMTFVYSMIAFKVNFRNKSNSNDQIFNHRGNRRKVNKIIVALTASFIVCWFPFFIYRAIIYAYDIQELMKFEWWWSIGIRVGTINTWLSVVLNPILFSLMSTKFRKALKTIWIKKMSQQAPYL